jgi:hypothetical protein
MLTMIDEEEVSTEEAQTIMNFFYQCYRGYVDALVICDSTLELSMYRDPDKKKKPSKKSRIMNTQTLGRLREHIKQLPETIAKLSQELPVINTPLVIANLDSTLDQEIYYDLFSRTVNTLLRLSP